MKKLILTIALTTTGIFAFGQWGSWGDTEDTKPKKEEKKNNETKVTKADTAKPAAEPDGYGEWGTEEESNSDWGGGSAWGSSGGGSSYEKQKASKPMYIKEDRVFLPYDSVRKLIVYTGVQELEECEFCTEDSLYYRFKIWAEKEFGAKIFKDKKAIGLDQKFQKITMRVKVPLMVENNKYTLNQVGSANVSFTMWFQPYRYKYLFTNFVHEVPPTGTQTEAQMVYFEYYQESKRNSESNNSYLKAIDKKVNNWVDKMKIALNDKPMALSEDDDW
mgnify:CR=1 FL=1